MMFMAFRFILIFFAIVQLILAVFALISGYSTNFLSKFYLLDVNVQQAKLAALINTASYINQKRDNIGAFGQNPTQAAAAVPSTTAATQNAPVPAATENENTVATIATAAAANSVATATTAAAAAVGTTPGTAANLATVGNPSVAAPNPATVNTGTGTTSAPTGFVTVTVAGSLQVTPASAVAAASTVYAAGSLQATVNQLVGLTAAQIGLADVYSFSLWGYCRGTSTSENLVIVNGVASTSFDNANVNFTWCSPPKAAYYFDPTQFLTTEINNAISNNPSITAQTKADLQAFLQTLSNDHITLPGNLSKQLGMIKSMSQASFGLILAVIAMVFLSILIDLLGCCLSPGNCCLSFANFLYEVVIWALNLVAAAIVTALAAYIKSQINDNNNVYGLTAYLSTGFYAFIWSSVVAGWLVVIIGLLGHCLGMFNTGRKRFRKVEKKK